MKDELTTNANAEQAAPPDAKHLLSAVFSVGKKVFFEREKLPYEVMAVSDRYAVCVRRLNRNEDAKLLHDMVNVGAYMSFTQAYKDNKDCPVYTIVDFEENVKAPDDLIFPILNYFEKSECEKAIQMLNTRQIGLSKRNKVELCVDWGRSLK